MVSIQKSNAKLDGLKKATGKKVYTFSLLSGHSCPFAEDCLSKVVISNGKRKIKDGPRTQFRCFSASQEVQYTNVYNDRKGNFDSLRGLSQADMTRTLDNAVKQLQDDYIMRLHVGGDFFSPKYFRAWLNVASLHPENVYYAYTKSLTYWAEYRRIVDKVPNFVLTASYGGRRDDLIESGGLRYAKVVFSEAEAEQLGLSIDHDDTHAALPEKRHESFALLLHGTQPQGTAASTALKKLNGKGSYRRV